MIIRTMKEMETNTTEVRLTYFCKFRVPMVMNMVTVMFLSRRLTISFPFGSGIIIATMSSTPVVTEARERQEEEGDEREREKIIVNCLDKVRCSQIMTTFDNSMPDLIAGNGAKFSTSFSYLGRLLSYTGEKNLN